MKLKKKITGALQVLSILCMLYAAYTFGHITWEQKSADFLVEQAEAERINKIEENLQEINETFGRVYQPPSQGFGFTNTDFVRWDDLMDYLDIQWTFDGYMTNEDYDIMIKNK